MRNSARVFAILLIILASRISVAKDRYLDCEDLLPKNPEARGWDFGVEATPIKAAPSLKVYWDPKPTENSTLADQRVHDYSTLRRKCITLNEIESMTYKQRIMFLDGYADYLTAARNGSRTSQWGPAFFDFAERAMSDGRSPYSFRKYIVEFNGQKLPIAEGYSIETIDYRPTDPAKSEHQHTFRIRLRKGNEVKEDIQFTSVNTEYWKHHLRRLQIERDTLEYAFADWNDGKATFLYRITP